MNVLITGGTGFVGHHVSASLRKKGHTTFILTRSPDTKNDTTHLRYIGWMRDGDQPELELPHIDAVIHLAGTSINGRWTDERKKQIRASRIDTTREIVRIMKRLPAAPEVFVSASAVGFYAVNDDAVYTEENHKEGSGFLADVCKVWEAEARQAPPSTRTVLTRFGVILGEEGAFPKMVLPFKCFVGGKIGPGDQWISWVHIEDVVGLIHHAIFQEDVTGPLNVTAPHPVTMDHLGREIARQLKRPYWLPAPTFALKTALGEMSTLLIDSQKILPQKAEQTGYQFTFNTIEKAANHLLRNSF
ncbi:TIGR01777 family protein [Bacillaceae bacterium SIJ1]|uniref:TIGR01777 family oxidoreductase n=1 Tax=Litoribacterium kuwaitense TaxID=1398745 RepID=UPI0013ECEA86|nr:TIGR01777 family oxidoreductase [Litoribacterium kuwaitense]NGP46566.1 TIGR01777 family protein [Litoribacterium kuwaitense]